MSRSARAATRPALAPLAPLALLALLAVLVAGATPVAPVLARSEAPTQAPSADGGAAAIEPLDFSTIAAGPVVVTPDPSGRSAVLEVATTVEAACSVVYGPDERFGMIAVDEDMVGGAHREHRPVLGGLEPDTEYRYRLQGTDAQGRLYVSDVRSFRTPPAPEGSVPNLALLATVTGVSSEYSDAFRAELAFDGDPSTEWSSAGDGDDAWVEVDLGEPAAIGAVAFRTRSMGDGSAVTRTFTLTADGHEVGTFPVDAPVGVTLEARTLRFEVAESTGGNTGAIEVEVLAAE